MPITESIQLPTFEELDVPDLTISHPVMVAAGTFFGKYCDQQSKVKACIHYCVKFVSKLKYF